MCCLCVDGRHCLSGHIHLLESRAQKMEACRDTAKFPGGSAVSLLAASGFLDVPGTTTSCAHSCWLEASDMDLLAQARTPPLIAC